MRKHTYAIVTTLLTLLGLGVLFSLRLVGLYSHQALALVLLLGSVWAIASRIWLARKGRLHPGLLRGLRGLRGRENRPHFLQAVGRASFWTAAAVACSAVFPRSAELTTLLGVVIGVGLLRVAASFLVPRRTNAGPTLVMAAGALVLAFDLGRGFVGGPAAAVEIAPPFEGEWLVLQGGNSPLQSHHLAAYNQRFALDLVRLEGGRIFTDDPGDANATVHSWEQPLVSPADGTVIVARDDLEDANGANFVTELADAAGTSSSSSSTPVSSSFLAHLRHGTLRVGEGDRVRQGDPLALAGNSGNTTMPHLHLQVQTHPDLWDPDNRSVPFAFGPGGRVLARNDRVGAPGR